MSGFTIYLGSLAIPWYNASLSVYYYLAACRRWKEEQIQKKFERFVHLSIVPIAVVIAIIPIFLDLYNPFYSYCYAVCSLKKSQLNVTEDVYHAHLEKKSSEYLLSNIFELFAIIGILISTCTLATMNICIIIAMRVGGVPSEAGVWSDTNDDNPDENPCENDRKRQENIATALSMSVHYSVTFFFTWTIPFVWMLFSKLHEFSDKPLWKFVGQSCLAIFLPLQGFLNALIYLRPRFKRIRKREPSYAITLRDVLFWSCTRRPPAEPHDRDCYLGSGMVQCPLQNHPSYIIGGIMFDLDHSYDIKSSDSSLFSAYRADQMITITNIIGDDENENNDGNVSDLSLDPIPSYIVHGVELMTSSVSQEEEDNQTDEQETNKDVKTSVDQNSNSEECSNSEPNLAEQSSEVDKKKSLRKSCSHDRDDRSSDIEMQQLSVS